MRGSATSRFACSQRHYASVDFCWMASTRSARLGPEARPVAIPEDVDSPGVGKAQGVVELPLRVRWSGPPKTYDLRLRKGRLRVYEQVLREGNDEDVRRYIDVNELLRLWDDLVLPTYVRRAWAEWFRRRGRADLAC